MKVTTAIALIAASLAGNSTLSYADSGADTAKRIEERTVTRTRTEDGETRERLRVKVERQTRHNTGPDQSGRREGSRSHEGKRSGKGERRSG